MATGVDDNHSGTGGLSEELGVSEGRGYFGNGSVVKRAYNLPMNDYESCTTGSISEAVVSTIADEHSRGSYPGDQRVDNSRRDLGRITTHVANPTDVRT